MNVLSVSVTERGRLLARRLPYAHEHGDAAATVRVRWPDVDAFVLFLATGAACRITAPLLSGKHTDPAVVCVDDVGRFAVSLLGGHAGGGNDLAREVAAVLGEGCQAVVTTATDATGSPALDALPGFVASGDVVRVTTALLDGRRPRIDNEMGWPLPDWLTAGDGPERIVVTDHAPAPQPGTAVLHPPSLVAGIGTATAANAGEVRSLLDDTLGQAGLAAESVLEVATIDRRADHPAVLALGLPVRTYSASQLSTVAVPGPSQAVREAVGTASVAEAAALLAAGPGAELVVPKRKAPTATVAIARRARPRGHLSVVGLGPGDARHRTPAATAAVRGAEVIIGYGPYVDQCADLLTAAQEVIRSPIGEEVVRAKQALAEAGGGRRVALVCSGDPGIYAMASAVLELTAQDDATIDLDVVPGVTAGLAAAALLGAPLGHDHVVISLSDLLTPWAVIEARLHAAAAAGLAVVLYNPRSGRRTWQLDAARQILLGHRPPSTPVGVVTDAARPGQRVEVTTLAGLDPATVGMTTCVIVGAPDTDVHAGRMVTPRGYRP